MNKVRDEINKQLMDALKEIEKVSSTQGKIQLLDHVANIYSKVN